MIKKISIAIVITFLCISCAEKESPAVRSTLNAVTLTEYLRAKTIDGASLDIFFSDTTRLWFGEKEGVGVLRTSSGGSWSEWDKIFSSKSEFLSIKSYEDSITAIATENNDFYRLVERPPARSLHTYYFDSEHKIEGRLIVAMAVADSNSSSGRFDEAVLWLKEKHGDEIQMLMPDDEIVRSLKNAQTWKRLLNEWRVEVGLDKIK